MVADCKSAIFTMNVKCDFTGKRKGNTCRMCGYAIPFDLPDVPVRTCDSNSPPCSHLGDQIQRDGAAITVKCNCPASSGDREVFYPVARCGVFNRCLPTARLTGEYLDRWLKRDESRLYAMCQLCPLSNTN